MTPDERDDVMNRPPADFGQVIAWLDEWADLGQPWPENERVQAARRLPPETSLADVLRSLGVDPTRLTGAHKDRTESLAH